MTRALGLFALAFVLAACAGSQASTPQGAGGAVQQAHAEVIVVEASRWAFDPATITLHQGVPVILELRSHDVQHGFYVPGLGLRADIVPDKATRVRVTPNAKGTFLFHCDYYCGSGHEGMAGQIVVE